MKLHFTDQTFSLELLRTASYGLYGGSELGEVLATAKQIREGDFESWHVAWQRTAARIEALAAHALDQGHRVSAGQAFLRASNYYRTAEFFLAPNDPRRIVTFEKSRTTFWRFLELSGLCVERIRIPYEGTMALLHQVLFDWLDETLEHEISSFADRQSVGSGLSRSATTWPA